EARVKSNREAFIDLWGPRIYRDALLDALRGGDRFSPTRCHVAFVLPTGRSEEDRTLPHIRDELGSALERFGWHVTDLIRTDGQTSDNGEAASFARVVQRELERAGHPTRVHLPPEWRSPIAARDDVALHVTGSADAPTHRSQVDILWHVSDAHRATRAIYDR